MLLAHAGHWITSVVWFLPVVAFLIWLGITQLRMRLGERRRQSEGDRGAVR